MECLEGSLDQGSFLAQTFGTVQNIKYETQGFQAI
jgi:hypothetical protein